MVPQGVTDVGSAHRCTIPRRDALVVRLVQVAAGAGHVEYWGHLGANIDTQFPVFLRPMRPNEEIPEKAEMRLFCWGF